MNKEILKELESKLLQEQKEITLGDTSKTTILETIKQGDMPLENILISLYNMAKISQYKVKELQENLDLLANRVYKTNEDFTQEEKSEISESLSVLELWQLYALYTIGDCKDYLYDSLYCDNEDFDKAEEQRQILFNKIKYPTPAMHTTFKELVNSEIMGRKCK